MLKSGMMMRFLAFVSLTLALLFAAACSSPDPEILGECDHSNECEDGQQCIDSMCHTPGDLSSNDEDEQSNADAPDSGISDTNISPPDTDTVMDDDTASDEDTYDGVDCRVEPCEEGLLCNESTGHCEECTIDEQCQENAVCNHQTNRCSCIIGYQYCDGECISLDSVDSCGSECVPCPQVDNGEAACIERQCGAECDDGFYYCDEDCTADPGHCVECIDDDHCTSRDAPVCDGGSCMPCTESLDCADHGDFPACDKDTGRCVECTEENTEACGDYSCHPEDFECTETPRQSVTICKPCLSDSECIEDHHCVPMAFDGEPRESAYCLKLESTGCDMPRFQVPRLKESVTTGELDFYCGVNEDVTTCEAVHDYDSHCEDRYGADCGHPDLDDAVCERIEFEPGLRCSYYCQHSTQEDSPEECDEEWTCGMSAGTGYCGGY